MPPITLHMVLARKVASELAFEELVGNAGPYLLGATSPDIRVLTRQSRFSTHFFDLEGDDHQNSVSAFLGSHKALSDPGKLTPSTRSWVAGYLGHLAMDQHYITAVYRPFFATHEQLGGTIRANVMDRLLQFDLDRAHGSDPSVRQDLAAALGGAVEGVECGFIDAETLDRWRRLALDVSQRDMDWDRMRAMISNHLRMVGVDEEAALRRFLDSLPELLDETVAHVTSDEIDGFVQRATDIARQAVVEYLGCE
ncbi:MAG TPA: zinc dependent phospholipase C family protein [Dehalococcoidia bacterium]|nr:zinc dependent phospholipase C family protein [Dehalococcoidia bacterium]